MIQHKWLPNVFLFLGFIFILDSCCSLKCFKVHDGLVGYGTIEMVASPNNFGLIKMHLRGEDHTTGSFLYRHDPSQNNVNIGSSVRFKVTSFEDISLAIDVALYNGEVDYSQHDELLALSKIEHRSNYRHPQFPAHKIGHLQRFNSEKSLTYNAQSYGLGEFNELNGIIIDSLWIPTAFDFNTCPSADSIWIYSNANQVSFEGKEVILEIGCSHEEFHQRN